MGEMQSVKKVLVEKTKGRLRTYAKIAFGILIAAAFVNYLILWKGGYRFTLKSLLRDDLAKGERSLQLKGDEFIFDCTVKKSIEAGDREIIADVNVIRKSGLLYKQMSVNSACVDRYLLRNSRNDDVGSVTVVQGKERYFLFFSPLCYYVVEEDRSKGDLSNGPLVRTRVYTDYVTVNGNLLKLENLSFVTIEDEIQSVVINGEEVTMIPR